MFKTICIFHLLKSGVIVWNVKTAATKRSAKTAAPNKVLKNSRDKTESECADTNTIIHRFCDKEQILVNSHRNYRNQRRNTSTDQNS